VDLPLLDRFYDRASGNAVPVTYAYLGLSVAATVVAMARPDLEAALDGIAPREHAWQPLTAAFLHGWPGVPRWLHLVVNGFLMLRLGPYCERLLGSGRFLLLSVLALAANAAVLTRTDGVNGSSLVMWAWGPPLFFALATARRADPTSPEGPIYRDVQWVLVLFYAVVIVLMAIVPYVYGWRGTLLAALARGNLFHLIATAIGIVFALVLRGWIARRLLEVAGEET
jgi:membrane associated rhomboid family serine protease